MGNDDYDDEQLGGEEEFRRDRGEGFRSNEDDETPVEREEAGFWSYVILASIMAFGGILGGTAINHLKNKEISRLETALTEKKTANDEDYTKWEAEHYRLKARLEHTKRWAKEDRAKKTSFFVGVKCGIPELAESDDLFTWNEGRNLINAGVERGYLTFKKHEIQQGDTLGGICSEYGADMQAVVDMNNVFSVSDEVQTIWDKNLIREGKLLLIPQHDLKTIGEYVVQKGDDLRTCLKKSREFFERKDGSCSYDDFSNRFYLLNRMAGRLDKDNEIVPGMKLLIPDDEVRN